MQIFHKIINDQALEVCQKLQNAGYQAYIVGGCVRDLVLGNEPHDWDITTEALPEQILQLFPKNYPTGLQHGTVTVALPNKDGIDEHFEVTTFRVDGEYKDGRRPEEVFFVNNIEEDLARRDLTFNAIAYDPINKNIIDPFDGLHDLQYKNIRAVGLPDARFQEDGLRIMRVARFAARFNYQIDLPTLEAMSNNLDTLKKVSKERIKDELCKLLRSPYSSYGLQILFNTGVLQTICPFLIHLPANQDKCQGDLETKLALLFGNCSENQIKKELTDLKFSNKEIKRISFLLDLLDRYIVFVKNDDIASYKSFIAYIKNNSPDHWSHALKQFIILSGAIGLGSEAMLNKYQDETVYSRKELQIDGDDLLSLGIKAGPDIKNILNNCYLEILKNPESNNKEFLFKFAISY